MTNAHLSYGGEPPAPDPHEVPDAPAAGKRERPEFRGFNSPESTNIVACTWWWTEDPVIGGILRVAFVNGSVYEYTSVGIEVYEELRTSPSVGRAFDRLIRKGGYDYRRVADHAVGMGS